MRLNGGTGGTSEIPVPALLGVAGLEADADAGGVTELELVARGRRADFSGIGGGTSASISGNAASCGPEIRKAEEDVRFELLPLVEVRAKDSVVDGGRKSPVFRQCKSCIPPKLYKASYTRSCTSAALGRHCGSGFCISAIRRKSGGSAYRAWS